MTFLYISFHFVKTTPINACDVQCTLAEDSGSSLLIPGLMPSRVYNHRVNMRRHRRLYVEIAGIEHHALYLVGKQLERKRAVNTGVGHLAL